MPSRRGSQASPTRMWSGPKLLQTLTATVGKYPHSFCGCISPPAIRSAAEERVEQQFALPGEL
jgi:hypothetical protein